MNTQSNEKRATPFHKIVFRLWAQMMVLVLLAVAFIGVAQVFLFEHNYVETAVKETEERLTALEPQLEANDLAEDQRLFLSLSMSVNGKMMLLDSQGALLGAYSFGHPFDLENDRALLGSWEKLQKSDDFQKILNRDRYTAYERSGTRITWVRFGLPVEYDGQDCYVLMYHSLSDIYSMLAVNRQQLVILCVLLTVVASVLAALMARQFTKPVFAIKRAVDSLAKGDLTAAPNLDRRDELGQLSDSVAVLGQELQRVEVLRREVIANVSHELRTPLAHIGGYAEMVRDITWPDEQKRNEDLNFIIREIKRMTEMVNDILDYSQLQAGFLPLKQENFNLYDIIESEIDNCRKSAEENTLSLVLRSTQTEYPVFVDALKLSQVIRNLIYNAINHTADGGTVTVALEAINDAAVRVSVINPGEPIPQEERTLIWERYQRSQHQGGRREGTGIGLSIVSTILQAHDMPYGVDCEDGLTSFWFQCRISRAN